MSDQRQKKKILSAHSSPLRALRSRPPSPNNVVQAGVCITPSESERMPSEAPSAESLADPVICIDDSQVVNESHDQRPDRNTANPQRTTAMFSDIEQLHIGVGNFTQVNINNNRDNDDPLKHDVFRSLPRSRDAAFSAAINLDNLTRRRCTEGTRVDIIAQIMAWINENDPSKAPPVYWLTGLAGLGKTTIAYSICDRLEKAHLPFASYFCSLQLDSKNSKLLVTTLCRALAQLYNPYASSVLPVLETNADVVDAGLSIQIDQLLAKPWQASIGQWGDCDIMTPIVVVDALDECDRGTEFLEELLRVIQVNHLSGIKFLVTSRTDPKIVNICKSFPPNAVCKLHEVDTANVQNDIKKYLQEALPELKDDPELALLSRRAGGLFIYATTAVRFISPSHTSHSVPEMRSHLQAMLDPDLLTSHDESDERLLVDELYERILGDAFRSAGVRATRLRILLTIVCAESRVGIPVLADLAETDEDTVKRVVESLHAVLFVSPKDGCVYWYHASFPEFFFSRTRSRINLPRHGKHRPLEFDTFCDGPALHSVLAQRCLSVMQKSLHFNMCKLPSSYTFDCDVPGLQASVDSTFSPTLRYVLRHWARHLVRAVPAKNVNDDLLSGLKDFMDNKLLFWIEAMNLLGAKTECFSLLKDAGSWLEREKECQPDLLGQLTDAMNFSTFFVGSPASNSTPHLYISALSMWNQDSPIWRNWRDRFRFIPSISLPRSSVTIPLLTIPTDGNGYVAISFDGNQIITGSRIWDATTGELLKMLTGGVVFNTSIAFSPDGNRLVSGSLDGSVRVWNAETGEQLRELQGHTDSVLSVAFSPDGNQVVSGSVDKSVRLWDLKTGEQLREFQRHTNKICTVAFSPDGNRIVSGSWDESVRVWDATTGEQVRELEGHSNYVKSVAFSPDGNRIVSGSWDRSVRVWDAKTGEQLRELQGHTNNVTSVAFSPDGNRIVSGSWDRSVRVWDAKTGEQLRDLQGHTDDVYCVSFLPDGNRVVSGSKDRSVLVWDAKTGEQLREPQGHTDAVNSVAFSPDGNRIVSGSSDRSVRLWDSKTGKQLRVLQGHTRNVTTVAFSPDGNLIVSGSQDGPVRVWDSKTGQQVRELQGSTDYVLSVAFSPDGNRIVSGSSDKSVQVWDAMTGEQLRKLRGHRDNVNSVAYSPDGNRIVSGSWDGSVRLWDSKTGEQLRKLQGHTDSDIVSSVAFSPDGSQVVSSSPDRSVRVWDSKTGERLRKLPGHTYAVISVTYSPDGNRIVSGSWDRSVRVWDVKTGKQLRVLQGHTHRVLSVAFSPDCNQIVSGSYDESVRVWANLNLDTPWAMGGDGWILSDADMLVWVPSSIRSVLLSPHNTLIISRNGSAAISFNQCKLGTFWHECYTP